MHTKLPLPLGGVHIVVHQAPPTLEEIAARIGRLRGVLYRMGERSLDHLAGCARPFLGPVPEARPEPMRHGGEAEFLDQFRERRVGEWLPPDCGILGPCRHCVSVRRAGSRAPAPREGRGDPASRRWCADAGRPTRFKPSRPSPTDAVRDGSAKLGHPVQNVTREHGLTPLPR